jgi:hypothetical protein
MTSNTFVGEQGRRPQDPRLEELTGVLLETMTARGADVARHVRDRIDFYRENDAVSPEDLESSCVENLRFVVEGLGRGEVSDPAPAATTGVRRAQAGVPLSAVLAAYRIGFRVMWEHVTEESQRRGIPAEVVLAATADAVVAHDVFTEAMTGAYNATMTERLVSEEAERSALVEALLTGSVVDRRTLWEIADLLGLPVSGSFVVVAAMLTSPGRTVLPGIEPDLARQGFRSAWRLLADVQVGLVELGDTRIEDLLDVLEASGSVQMGISPVFAELTGAARGVELARLASAVAPATGGAARFEDNPVGIVAAAAGDVMERMAAEVLGPLDTMAEAERHLLLQTLRVWVEVGGSATKAANRLFCHANTIRHRLRRFEERTGRRLDHPADVAALCLALEVTRD